MQRTLIDQRLGGWLPGAPRRPTPSAKPGSYECLRKPNTPGCKDLPTQPLDLEAAARVRAAADAAAAAEAAKAEAEAAKAEAEAAVAEAARLQAEAAATQAAADAQAVAAAKAIATAQAATTTTRWRWIVGGGLLLALATGFAVHKARRR